MADLILHPSALAMSPPQAWQVQQARLKDKQEMKKVNNWGTNVQGTTRQDFMNDITKWEAWLNNYLQSVQIPQ